MSYGASRFRSGKRVEDKGKKPKVVIVPIVPAPAFEVTVENDDELIVKKAVIGDANASFLGDGLIQIYTEKELSVDMNVRLRKKSTKPNSERCWICTVINIIKEGVKKNVYLLQEK